MRPFGNELERGCCLNIDPMSPNAAALNVKALFTLLWAFQERFPLLHDFKCFHNRVALLLVVCISFLFQICCSSFSVSSLQLQLFLHEIEPQLEII